MIAAGIDIAGDQSARQIDTQVPASGQRTRRMAGLFERPFKRVPIGAFDQPHVAEYGVRAPQQAVFQARHRR